MAKKKIQKKPPVQYWQILVALILGIAIGIVVSPQPEQPALASALEKDIAKEEIFNLFLKESSTECSDPSDPIKPEDRVAVFNEYLQINGFANRAVIRGCNDSDRLLAKTKQGVWMATDVNVKLDARANPKWQKECLIQDITVADTKVRPENSYIDSRNFELCQKLEKL